LQFLAAECWRPKHQNRLFQHFLTDGCTFAQFLPSAVFWFVPPEILPWANLFWPYRPIKHSAIDLYIKTVTFCRKFPCRFGQ
jgi:hypothetical protein